MKKLPLIPFPLWSQFGISVISALLLISCVWSHDPSTCGLAPKGAQDSLRLSLQPDSLSHHFSLTSCEIRPFLVALSMTSVSFSLCSLPCSTAPRGLLSPASSGNTCEPLSSHFLLEVISAWERQLHSSCHINDILVATSFFLNRYKLDFEMSKSTMKDKWLYSPPCFGNSSSLPQLSPDMDSCQKKTFKRMLLKREINLAYSNNAV